MITKPITRLILPPLLITSVACEFVLGPQVVAATLQTHEIYAGFTHNKDIPFIMLHRTGESLGAIGGDGTSTMKGVVWVSSDGKSSIVVYSDNNGLPQSAVAGTDVIVYSGYNNDTVDITIVHANGQREILKARRDIELLNKITSALDPALNLVEYSPPASRQFQQQDLSRLKDMLYLLGAAVCIGSIALTAAAPPAGIPTLAPGCVGFILGSLVRAGHAMNLDVSNIETAKNAWDVVSCLGLSTISPIACANALLLQDELGLSIANKRVNLVATGHGQQQGTFAFDTAPPPAATSPTPSPTNPPSVSMLPGTVTQLSNCRYGPDYPYLYKYGVRVGTKMEVIGRDADGNWLQVRGVGGNNPCWIKGVQMQVDGDVMGLPDAYPTTTGLPISPFFEQITLTGVSTSGGAVNVTWLEHEIRSDLGTEQGFEYIVEVWTCVNGKPNFSAIGTNDTSASFQIDNSCGVPSHADVIGEDKEGFSVPAMIALP